MTTQFDLTEDQRAIQDMARKFTADAITPHAAHWDEAHHFPRDVVKASAALGFGAIYVSEKSNGIGLGRLEAALIMEAMAYGCATTSSFISIHNMAAWMIDCYGSPEIKAKFLPDLVGMEKIASYCLTEPGVGSDSAGITTTAVKDGDEYVINGEKICGVLMLTAFSQREVVEQARDAGALAFLVKPFQKSDLIPAIEVAMGRFRELRTLTGEIDALGEQLESRKVVERAKGVLMDEVGMSETDSFAFIQRTAMSERTRMRDVADRILDGSLRPGAD